MERIERCDIFRPTAPQQQLLLDLLQRADCSLEDIAEALRSSVAALTVYLASDDAIEILAQAELANARRGRLAATAQLDKCVHALSLILDRYISDTTIAVRRDTPKNRREDLIHQESARRAAAQLFKVANFTPRIVTSQLTTNPTRKRGATTAPNNTAATPTPTTPPTAPVTRLLAPPQHQAEGADSSASGQTSEWADASDLQPPSTITTDARDLPASTSTSTSHSGARHRDHSAPSRARDAPSCAPAGAP
ncbi:MAG: hypothetical protein K2Y21_09875 [Phycisphaerales bacterium]|nr:hypothetical protein [Phycisphaerales bacterium]